MRFVFVAALVMVSSHTFADTFTDDCSLNLDRVIAGREKTLSGEEAAEAIVCLRDIVDKDFIYDPQQGRFSLVDKSLKIYKVFEEIEQDLEAEQKSLANKNSYRLPNPYVPVPPPPPVEDKVLVAYKDEMKRILALDPSNYEYYLASEKNLDVEKIEHLADTLERDVRVYARGKQINLDEEGRALHARLKERLSSKQSRLFPKLRDKYGPLLRANLWIDDGSAKTVSRGYRTIKIYHGSFALNRSVQEAHNALILLLLKLRFTRAEYHWIESDYAEYTWYGLEPPDDSALGTWQGGTFTPVE